MPAESSGRSKASLRRAVDTGRSWLDLHQQSPEEFEEACRFGDTIRHLPGVKGECFLHSSSVSLRQIDFTRTCGQRRPPGRGQALLFDGGEGVCSL